MTGKRLVREKLPHWPRYMTRDLAAAYVGVSETVFAAEVAAWWWHLPRRRGAKSTLLTWDRVLLDQAADREAGLEVPPAAAPVVTDDEVRSRFRAKTATRRTETDR